jgi:hypothetical protein
VRLARRGAGLAPEKATPAAKIAAPKPKREKEEARRPRGQMFWASMESFFEPIWGYIRIPASRGDDQRRQEIFFEQKGKLVRSDIVFSEEVARGHNERGAVHGASDQRGEPLPRRAPSDGSRVAIVLPPCSRKGRPWPSEFAKERMTLKDLVFGAMSDEVVQFSTSA